VVADDVVAVAPSDEHLEKARLARQEVVRSLELQERALESLRTRGGVMLSTALILAGLATSATRARDAAWWAGVAALAVVTVSAALAIWPIQLWSTFSGFELVGRYVDDPEVTPGQMHRDLALYGQADLERNNLTIRRRRWCFVVAVAALAAEACLLAASVHAVRG
jgi:hypothetical protein